MFNSQVNPIHGNQAIDDCQYLKEDDWIIISYHNYILYSQGFKTSQLKLQKIKDSSIISCIFVIESYGRLESEEYRKKSSLVFYGQRILLRHLLSGKYLSYSHQSNVQEVSLKYAKTQNCLFMIKPIFKCQASFGRKIRIGQHISLQSLQKLKLYIELGQIGDNQIQCLVSMRKHESSLLMIERLNSLQKSVGKVSNLLVYQLYNIETQHALDATQVKDHKYYQLGFSKNINAYGSFIIIQPKVNSFKIQQILINFNMEVYIRFYTHEFYLSVDGSNNVCFTQQKGEQGVFLFEDYDKQSLDQSSTLKIKHVNSGLYLSFDREVCLRPFSLKNTYSLKKVQNSILKITLLANYLFDSFTNIFKDDVLKNRILFERLTKELIKFIYASSFSQENYLKMNQVIKIKITPFEQNLLAKVGFIDLLSKAVGDFISILDFNNSEGKVFYHQRIFDLMLALLGICYKNQQNTEKIIQYLPIIYEGLPYNSGVIESLFYLFSDSVSLRQLERALHQTKKGNLRSIQYLISVISKQKSLDNSVKQKLLKLLQQFTKPVKDQKLLLHKFSLIRAFKENRLNAIWMQTKLLHEDIYVKLQDDFIQLVSLFQKRGKYNQEIDQAKAQFHLMCTLYSYPNAVNLADFRNIFPESALLNYLKTKTEPSQRKIFLRILNEIYLTPLINERNYLKSLQNQQQLPINERFNEAELRILEKMRNQVVQAFQRSIVNQIVDESLCLQIKAIRKFFKLQIIEQKQWERIQQFMQKYMQKNFDQIDKFKEVKSLALQIIKAHQCTEQATLFKYLQYLVKELHKQSLKLQKIDYAQTAAIKAYKSILSEPYFCKKQPKLAWLNDLLEYSLQNDSQIFLKASLLLKKLVNRKYLLLQKLRMVIFIESENDRNLIQEGKKLHQQLINLLTEQKNHNGHEQNNIGVNISVCKKINQIKQLYFKNELNNNEKPSSFVQNIFRQLGIQNTILNFIRDEQRQLRKIYSTNVFYQLFNFIIHFIYNNFTNIQNLMKQFRLISWLFTYEDVGQSKILYVLVNDRYTVELINKQLVEAAFRCLRVTKKPSCYGIMSLVFLMINKGKKDEHTINYIAQQIIKQPDIVYTLWKVQKGSFKFQQENKEEQNYHEDFGFYLFFVIRLFMIIIQYTSYQKEIMNILNKRIPFKLLLSIISWKDLINDQSSQYFGSLLLKTQLIRFFEKIYDIQTLEQAQIVAMHQVCFDFNTSLIGQRNFSTVKCPTLKDEKGLYQIQFQALKIKDNLRNYPTDKDYNLVVLTVFYPFILSITQKIYNISSKVQISRDIQSIWLTGYRKIKETFALLEKESYLKNYQRYNSAINLIEEILKCKIDYQISQIPKKSIQNYKQPIQKIYLTQKLHIITDCCLQTSRDSKDKISKTIYRMILLLMYSPKVRKILEDLTLVIETPQQPLIMQSIFQMIAKLVQEDLINSAQAIDFIWIFLKNHTSRVRIIQFKDSSLLDVLGRVFIKSQGTSLFKETLSKFLQINSFLINEYLSSSNLLQNNIFQNNDGIVEVDGKIQSIDLCLSEIIINKINAQISNYSQIRLSSQLNYLHPLGHKTNYESIYQQLSLYQGLDFIRNKLKISSKISQHYVNVVKDMIKLMRVYLKFISQFQFLYFPKEIYHNINIILQAIILLLDQENNQILTFIFQQSYYNEISIILELEDEWQIVQKQSKLTERQFMNEIAQKMVIGKKQWVQEIQILCKESQIVYGKDITYQWANFPLQPISRSLFCPLKKTAIQVLKTLKKIKNKYAINFFVMIKQKTLIKNIKNIYYKHNHLFRKYNIISVKPSVVKYRDRSLQLIAINFCFANGVDLISLLMYHQACRSKTELEEAYSKYWLSVQSFRGWISEIFRFISDILLIFRYYKESLIPEHQQNRIFHYFYSKMGRVEVIEKDKIVTIDFIINPECIIHKSQKSLCIQSINFVSNQTKLQSILLQCINLSISFDCFSNFLLTFRRLGLVIFLQKYFSLLRFFSMALVLINNIALIINSNVYNHIFYSEFIFNRFFERVLLTNMAIAVINFIIYCSRHIPIIIAQANYLLGNDKKGNLFNHSKSAIRIKIIKNIFSSKDIAYHFLYLIILLLALINKQFISLLLLDILYKFKNMKILLDSLWHSLGEFTYTIISFFLLHYFYTIMFYYIYRHEINSQNLCKNLSQCLGFVLDLTYKVVGGFPGYLYQLRYNSPNFQASFHAYDIIQDIYLIVTFQIYYSVLLVIIITEYSKIIYKETYTNEVLTLNCLVCGLPRTIFNTSSKANFRSHITVNHKVWNYVFYYHYIKCKSIRQRTKLQNYIILKHKIDWIPNGYAQGFQEPEKNTKILRQYYPAI